MKKIALSLIALLFLSSFLSAEDYWKGEEYFRNSSSQKEAASDLLKFVPLKEDDLILDVGCGDGKISAGIARHIPKGSLVGIDISPSMIQFAQKHFPKERYPNLQFFIQDAQELDYHEEFNLIFSFTALQWVQKHETFIKGAYQALKPAGVLAITMPMGLPTTLEQAVQEIIASPNWSEYFVNFSTGWNFVKGEAYEKMLRSQGFFPWRVAVVPQRDCFPSREVFEKFITQWFPYLRPLPEEQKELFLKEVINRFLELEPSCPDGEIHFKIRRLEVIAIKN